MWLMTKHGFYSITQAPTQGQYQIRAREHHDLENLIAGPLVGCKIIKSPYSDYPYRIMVDGARLDDVMAYLASTLDYGNFKDQIHNTPDQAHKNKPYMQIWAVLAEALESFR